MRRNSLTTVATAQGWDPERRAISTQNWEGPADPPSRCSMTTVLQPQPQLQPSTSIPSRSLPLGVTLSAHCSPAPPQCTLVHTVAIAQHLVYNRRHIFFKMGRKTLRILNDFKRFRIVEPNGTLLSWKLPVYCPLHREFSKE